MQVKNGDSLIDLPVDQTQPSHAEIKIVNTLFKEHSSTLDKLAKESREAILVGVLFVLFSRPELDEVIQRFVPVTVNSEYLLVLVKMLAIMVVFWITKHFYLARKTN